MGIIADSRHEAVERWLDQQFTHLRELAHNSSLQFYAMDLIEEDAKPPGEGVLGDQPISVMRVLLGKIPPTMPACPETQIFAF